MANTPVNNHSFRTMTQSLRDKIRTQLIDSMIDNPRQSPSERSAETSRIARRNKVTNLQVAAIRANLTRGAYGSVSTLKSRRRKELRASA